MSTSDNNLFLIRSLLVDEVRRLQAILDAKDGEITSLSGIEPLEAKAEAVPPVFEKWPNGVPATVSEKQAFIKGWESRPAPAYALREDFLAFCEVVLKWLDAPMGFRAVSLEDIHAMTRKHISALRQSAKEGA